MNINEMILVVSNYKGRESNFLMTFEDFRKNMNVNRYEDKNVLADVVMELGRTLADNKKWVEIYSESNKTISARFCSDEHQLVAFLHGKYNDSKGEWNFERGASSVECDVLLEVLGIDDKGLKKSVGYEYKECIAEFYQGDILQNFNGNFYRVMEVLKKKDLVLMDINTGKFIVGLGTRMFERFPKGMPKDDDHKVKRIEWDNGIYLSQTPSDIDFIKIKEEYGKKAIQEPDGIKDYQIEIKEELARVESIQAETLGDAIDKAMDMYYGQDIILDADDMKNVDFKPYSDSKTR